MRHVAFFKIANPIQCLSLWINQQRIPIAAGHQNTVLNRQRIRWQTRQVPITDDTYIRQEIRQIQLQGKRNFPFFQIVRQFVPDQIFAEILIERSTIRDKGTGQGDIANQTLFDVRKFFAVAVPTDSFPRQTRNQRRRLFHALAGVFRVFFDGAFGSQLTVEILLQGGQDILTRLETHFCFHQFSFGILQPGFGQTQRFQFRFHDLGSTVVFDHRTAPNAQAFCGLGGVSCGVSVESFQRQVRSHQFDGFIVDEIFFIA